MPRYDWKCLHCDGETEVFRRMSDCMSPPIDDCQGCVMIASEKVLGCIKMMIDLTPEDWDKIDEEMPVPSWKKCIIQPHIILNEDHKIKSPDGKGGSQRGWPIKVPGLIQVTKRDSAGNVVYVKEIVGTDPRNGNPVIKFTPAKEYRDMIFKSRKHQREWLKENGMVLMMDGRSSSTGNSETGKYGDHGGDPAPSSRAQRMAAAGRFVEAEEITRMVKGA